MTDAYAQRWMAACGPQFAAAQRDVSCQRSTGRSAATAYTAAPDPNRTVTVIDRARDSSAQVPADW